jgi:hypothetical protein
MPIIPATQSRGRRIPGKVSKTLSEKGGGGGAAGWVSDSSGRALA